MAGLASKFLAARTGGGQTGFHPLAEQITLELGDPGQHGGHHPSMRCVELEGHAVHGNDGDFPACELVEGIEQVLGGAPPPGEFTDQDGVELPGLCQIKYPVAGGAIS